MKNGLEGRKLEHKKKEKKRKWRANRLNRYTKSHDIYFWNSLLKTMGSDKIPSEYLKHSLFHLENERLTFHPATNWLKSSSETLRLDFPSTSFPWTGVVKVWNWKKDAGRNVKCVEGKVLDWKHEFSSNRSVLWKSNIFFNPLMIQVFVFHGSYMFIKQFLLC